MKSISNPIRVALGLAAISQLCCVASAAGQSLTSGPYRLSFPALVGGRGLRIERSRGSGQPVLQAQPAQILVKVVSSTENSDTPQFAAAYSSVTQQGWQTIQAQATVTSANGSIFLLSDTYKAGDAKRSFTVSRTVQVQTANANDLGWNSRFTLGFERPVAIDQYHFFAPGIWYDKNSAVVPGAFASDYSNNYFYWRETRSGLPVVMMQDGSSGTTLALAHLHPNPSSGLDERSQEWLVGDSVQYASIGAQKVPQVELGLIYPAWEGEKNYVGPRNTLWVRRSHPVQAGFSHSYTLDLRLGQVAKADGSEFRRAMQRTWRHYFDGFLPPIAPLPLETVYMDGVNLLDHYSEKRPPDTGAQGEPFSAQVPSGVVPSDQISYWMGFAGMQIPAGYQMIRYGLQQGNDPVLSKGIATLDFWAHTAASPFGLPRTWYNVQPPTFRDDDCIFPIFLRVVSDGMEGALDAARIVRVSGQPKPDWEKFVTAFGDWLVRTQNSDGSFYRAFNASDGSVFTGGTGCNRNGAGTSKSDTAHPIRFLVALYFATGNQAYLNAAVAAGNYAYTNSYLPTLFIGGTVDNPNTVDKEAGALALHAFLALWDGTHDTKWLDAAVGAATYTETWMYAWNFKLNASVPAFDYAGVQGESLIATGQSGSDIYLAFEAYDFYRLHLLRDNRKNHFLKVAEYLASNTKLSTKITGVPEQDFGFAFSGLVSEANDFSFMNVRGYQNWLPWLTVAEIEPLAKLKDTFGSMSVQGIEQQPRAQRERKNREVYAPPGSIGWGEGN